MATTTNHSLTHYHSHSLFKAIFDICLTMGWLVLVLMMGLRRFDSILVSLSFFFLYVIFLLVPFVVRVLLDVQIDDICVCSRRWRNTCVFRRTFHGIFSHLLIFFHICFFNCIHFISIVSLSFLSLR